MKLDLPFKPIQDIVIALACADPEVRASGIVIPFDAERTQLLQVLACGPGQLLINGRRTPMRTEPGDLIVVNPARVQQFIYHERTYLAVREPQVIGVIEGETLFPLNDFVIAEQLATERVNMDGGIVIPGVADDNNEDTLVGCSINRLRETGTRERMLLQPGDQVLYNKRMGDHFRLHDRALVAFREEHVVCVTTQLHEAAD